VDEDRNHCPGSYVIAEIPRQDDGFKVDFIIKKPFDLTELSENINDMISTDGR
jgi:hypothetical protein